MFVGHYAASFVAKGLEPRASLALLFIAAQFLDFVFFPLVLLGGEQLLLLPNATQSTHFELPFMPYSHSIWAGIFWSTIALIHSFVFPFSNNMTIGLSFLSYAGIMGGFGMAVGNALALFFGSAETPSSATFEALAASAGLFSELEEISSNCTPASMLGFILKIKNFFNFRPYP